VDFYAPAGKIARFLLVAEMESIVCLLPAPLLRSTSLWYQSIDLSTDPGLKSHLINFPCSE
jgi:hypothetical protein